MLLLESEEIFNSNSCGLPQAELAFTPWSLFWRAKSLGLLIFKVSLLSCHGWSSSCCGWRSRESWLTTFIKVRVYRRLIRGWSLILPFTAGLGFAGLVVLKIKWVVISLAQMIDEKLLVLGWPIVTVLDSCSFGGNLGLGTERLVHALNCWRSRLISESVLWSMSARCKHSLDWHLRSLVARVKSV